MKTKKILFVCTGNTCRSPMAEAVLKNKLKKAGLKGIRVSSAGLAAEAGAGMSENSVKALKSGGYRAGAFKSKQVTPEMIRKCDLVLCMTGEHKRYLAAFERVYTIGEATGLGDIPDPYGGDLETYKNTLRAIEKACDVIIKEIINVKGDSI